MDYPATPTPLEELSTYKAKRAAMRAFLEALDDLGGVVEGHGQKSANGKTGTFRSATTLIVEQVDKSLTKNSADTWNKLRDGGWIDAPVRGKQVPRMELLHPLPWRSNGQKAEPTDDTQAVGPIADEEPSHVEPAPPSAGDDEADDLGMRPGRLAARLEKRLPELVAQAVATAMRAERDAIYNSQGYYYGISPEQYQRQEDEIEAFTSQVAHLQSTIESLNERNQRLGAMVDFLSDDEDARLSKTNDGQVASKHSLTVSQVPDQHRRYAELALADGWTIKRTRGGHLAWRNPKTGKTVFGASTPGAQGTGIMARKLRRNGLVIDRVS